MNIFERCISLFSNSTCIGCEQSGVLVCDACVVNISDSATPSCYRCNAYDKSFSTCDTCRRHSRLTQVVVACEFDSMVKKLIYTYKYKQLRALAGPLARLCLEVFPDTPTGSVVVHVPTATTRVRQRGFDHAAYLAREIAAKSRLPHHSALIRIGSTQQVGASARIRRQQLQGGFRAVRKRHITGKTIILIDDVATTGATLEAAAWVLHEAGAKRIIALVVARG